MGWFVAWLLLATAEGVEFRDLDGPSSGSGGHPVALGVGLDSGLIGQLSFRFRLGSSFFLEPAVGFSAFPWMGAVTGTGVLRARFDLTRLEGFGAQALVVGGYAASTTVAGIYTAVGAAAVFRPEERLEISLDAEAPLLGLSSAGNVWGGLLVAPSLRAMVHVSL